MRHIFQPPVHAAFVKQRPQTGSPMMFPANRTNERAPLLFRLLGHAAQLANDALSSRNAGQQELPLTQRPTAAWVYSAIEPNWAHGFLSNWDGRPLFFANPAIDRAHMAGWNPLLMYPTVERGHPVPWGSTQPTLGG
jgi:hypothetical protein